MILGGLAEDFCFLEQLERVEERVPRGCSSRGRLTRRGKVARFPATLATGV